MQDYEILNQIKANGICAIVRGTSAGQLKKIAEALLKGGVKTVEVTFNTPGAAGMIEQLAQEYGKEMVIGAGTVLDPETARVAILAGAKFVLSPTLNLKVIEICQRYSVVMVPGVATATEALTAWENGARIIKIFPAGVLGAKYIKQLKGPLPQIEMMAVGAVSSSNLGEFFAAGACSAGIGGELVSAALVDAGNFAEITQRAAHFVDIFKETRPKE